MAFLLSQRAAINGFEFDVSESETHSSKASVTRHPVEKGAQISDHVVQEPDTLELSVIVSNTPIVSREEASTLDSKRAEEAYRVLLSIKERGETINVVTSLREYSDMIVESMSVQRDAGTGDVLAMSLSLTQIIAVTNQRIFEATPKAPADVRGQTKKDQGKKPTTPAEPEVDDKARSLLLQFGRAGSDALAGLTQ